MIILSIALIIAINVAIYKHLQWREAESRYEEQKLLNKTTERQLASANIIANNLNKKLENYIGR